MTLAQRGFLWLLAFVALVAGTALALAGVQLARIDHEAATVRQDVLVAELGRKLDGQAASRQTLGLVADGAIPRLLPDLTAAVIDSGGLIIASSAGSGRWQGDPVPAHWLDPSGAIRTGHWSGAEGLMALTGGGTLTAGAPLRDRSGHLIGAVVVEDSASAIPLLIGTLMPALLWGNLLVAALLPACWFGARLAVTPLAVRVTASAELIEALGRNQAAATPHQDAARPGDEFAAFGRAGRALLGDFDAAVEAVSIWDDDDAGMGATS